MIPRAFSFLGSNGNGDAGVALEVGMGSHRGAHYFLTFLIFGLIAGAASLITQGKLDAEAIWLLALGGIGAIVGSSRINDGKLARPFDLLAGALLTLAGLLGTLQGFNIHFLPAVQVGAFQALSASALLGIPLNFPFPALVNLFLGVQALRHGLAKSETL
jgi:hypothetical protein